MAATVRDVARLAGVSPSTVSNFLLRPEIVAERSRSKIRDAIVELGFVPNAPARQLRAGDSKVIGLVLLDAWLPFFGELARGVEEIAGADGFTVSFSNSNRDIDRELANLDLLESQRVRGLIVVPKGKVVHRLKQLEARGIQSVVVGPTEQMDDSSCVRFDNELGGRRAGDHLLGLGRQRIAFVGNPKTVLQSEERLRGLRAAAAGSATAQVSVIEIADLTVESGIDAGRRILELPPQERPTAVFASNDMVAIGVCSALQREGVRIPEDLAVVGFDDVPLAAQMPIPLTTIRQPAHLIGTAAAQLLLSKITGDRNAHTEPIPVELIVRESTVGRTPH